MTKVIATITTSLDGYTTGPNDGPGRGLGEGGERLHYWVFGGPWTYDGPPRGQAVGADREFLEYMGNREGAVIGGRGTYEAADHWGGSNPFGIPFFIVTHRPQEEPMSAGFTFVGSLEEALRRAGKAAGDHDVGIMGGAQVIREALAGGAVDELAISTAPVILGAGKRLFEGFDRSLNLEPLRVFTSPLATHVVYRIVR